MNYLGKRLLSGLTGAALGILCSILVNSTLIELCINVMFTIYFGLLFAGIGCLVLWRGYAESRKSELGEVRRLKDSIFSHAVLAYTFGGFMIFSGLLCFVLRKDWFVGIDYKAKIPFFAILSVSLTFIVVFLIVDCINCVASSCKAVSQPIVQESRQTYLMALSAILMGFLYGLIFGILDLEDVELYRMAIMAMKEESYCYPIGIIIGALTGILNEIMREGNENLSNTNKHPERV